VAKKNERLRAGS